MTNKQLGDAVAELKQANASLSSAIGKLQPAANDANALAAKVTNRAKQNPSLRQPATKAIIREAVTGAKRGLKK